MFSSSRLAGAAKPDHPPHWRPCSNHALNHLHCLSLPVCSCQLIIIVIINIIIFLFWKTFFVSCSTLLVSCFIYSFSQDWSWVFSVFAAGWSGPSCPCLVLQIVIGPTAFHRNCCCGSASSASECGALQVFVQGSQSVGRVFGGEAPYELNTHLLAISLLFCFVFVQQMYLGIFTF